VIPSVESKRIYFITESEEQQMDSVMSFGGYNIQCEPSEISMHYSWHCVDCPVRNSRGNAQCTVCGHRPGALAPPYGPYLAITNEEQEITGQPLQPSSSIVSSSDGESGDGNTPSPPNQMSAYTVRINLPMYKSMEVICGYLRRRAEEVELFRGDAPPDIVGLVAMFFPFTVFSWAENRSIVTSTMGESSKCRRRPEAFGQWQNCFALSSVGCSDIDITRRFQWRLFTARYVSGSKVIIGFIEENASFSQRLFVSGSHFAEFNGGYGVCSDGSMLCDGGSSSASDMNVELQWVDMRGERKCYFFLNGRKVFELPPDQQYKLAVAIHGDIEVICSQFEEIYEFHGE